MLKLLLVAVSVGLSNFAASIGLSLPGVNARLRLQVVVLFGLFEGGMPLVGLLIGEHLAGTLGGASRWIGGGLLVATGLYAGLSGRRRGGGAGGDGSGAAGTARMAVTALALSVDNLVVGFALGALKTSLAEAAVVIAGVSVLLSLIGLEIGARLGRSVERYSEEIGGGVLILVGVLILTRVIS